MESTVFTNFLDLVQKNTMFLTLKQKNRQETRGLEPAFMILLSLECSPPGRDLPNFEATLSVAFQLYFHRNRI